MACATRLVGAASCTDGSSGRSAGRSSSSKTCAGTLNVVWCILLFLRSHHPGSASLTCSIVENLLAEKKEDLTNFTLFSTAPLLSGSCLLQHQSLRSCSFRNASNVSVANTSP